MKITKLFIILCCVLTLGAFASGWGCGSGYLAEGDLASGAGDTGGTGSFEQDSPATIMSIDAVFPVDGSSGVVLGTRVSVTFSNALLASSLAGNVSVGLVGPVTSISAPTKSMSSMLSKATDIPGTPSLEEDGKTVTYTASENYTDCSIFEITVAGGADGVQGSDGSQLADDFTSQFMSACPDMYTYDEEGRYDVGFSGALDGDKLYVGAGATAYAGMGYSGPYYAYKPFVDKIDVSSGLGNPEWVDPYIPPDGLSSFPNEPTAVDVLVIEGILGTIGYERGIINNSDYSAYGWLQGLDPATGESIDPSAPGGQSLSFPPFDQVYCKAGVQSSIASNVIAIMCHTSDGISPVWSYLMTFDAAQGTDIGFTMLPSSNTQMFSRGAFDNAGNLYVTQSTFLREFDLPYDSVLSLSMFTANGLLQSIIPDPSPFAQFATPYSNGLDVVAAEENGSPVFYVAGHVDSNQGSSPDVDALLVKFDSQGNTLWSVTYNGLDIGGADSFNALTVDDDGNVYVTGFRAREELPGPFASIWRNDMILAKYSSSGEQQFLVGYTMGDYGPDDNSEGNDVLLNADGEIFVVGGVYEGAEDWNIAVWRFDNDGNGSELF